MDESRGNRSNDKSLAQEWEKICLAKGFSRHPSYGAMYNQYN